MTATPPPSDDRALKARLEALDSALDARRARKPAQPGNPVDDLGGQGFARAINVGMRVLSEFIAGILVGAVIGWQLDRWIGPSPLFLILFTGVGTAAGFWNVYRIASKPTAKP